MGSPDVISSSDADAAADDVDEFRIPEEDITHEITKGYAVSVLDAMGGEEEGEEDEEDDAMEDEDIASRRAASRVDAIINRVTDQLHEDAAEDVLVADDDEAATVASRGTGDAGSPTGSFCHGTKPGKASGRRQGAAAKRMVRNPARGADIAKILSDPRKPREVREYIAQKDFGRVPVFLRDVVEELDAEQRYIVSLREAKDPPKVFVRLLTQDEKEFLVKGLKQRFQQATAKYLKAGSKSRSKAELEAELEKITQDIQNLGRPYIFVEDEDENH